MRYPVGYDGWIRDVLVELSTPDDHLGKLLIDLNNLMFRTPYKAYVQPLPVLKPLAERFDLNLHVTTAELRKWLLVDHMKFHPVETEGGADIDFEGVAGQTKPAVFFSKTRGMVGWWIPKDVPVQNCTVQARQFALDSDLVVGAISNASGVFIVGRERQVPVDILPPLRFETISLLGSVTTDELAQSYERNHPFAGRLDDTQDWAPILLSPELRDTEYGSLLNIADQFLKGWSNNGETKYANFEYPDPRQGWAFPKPLPNHLNVDRLTYNWNTTGTGYTLQEDTRAFYALNRTGALPISYIPGEKASAQDQRTLTAEQTAYTWYSNLNNPYLVRVVQYASLYQIFRRFPMAKAPSPVPQSRLPEETFKQLTDSLIDRVASSTPAVRKELLSRMRKGDPRDPSASPEVRAAELDALAKWLAAMPADERDAVKQWISNSRDVSQILFELKNARSLADVDSQKLTLAQNVSKIIDRVKTFNNICHDLAIAEGIPDKYAQSIARASSGWIHTPSIVVSHNISDIENAVGGHNLRASVTKFEVDPSLPVGQTRVTQDGTIKFNPNDADRAQLIVSKVARAAQDNRNSPDHGIAAIKRAADTSLQQTRATPPRKLEEVLGYNNSGRPPNGGGNNMRPPSRGGDGNNTRPPSSGGDGGKIPPSGGRGFAFEDDGNGGGSRPIDRAMLLATDPGKGKRSITVTRQQDNRHTILMEGYSHLDQPHPTQHLPVDVSADYIARALEFHANDTELPQVRLVDFNPGETDALVENIDRRTPAVSENVRAILREDSVSEQEMSGVLHTPINYSNKTVTQTSAPDGKPQNPKAVYLLVHVSRSNDPNGSLDMPVTLYFKTSIVTTTKDLFKTKIEKELVGNMTPVTAANIIRRKFIETQREKPGELDRIQQQIQVGLKYHSFVGRRHRYGWRV